MKLPDDTKVGQRYCQYEDDWITTEGELDNLME